MSNGYARVKYKCELRGNENIIFKQMHPIMLDNEYYSEYYRDTIIRDNKIHDEYYDLSLKIDYIYDLSPKIKKQEMELYNKI